MAGDDPNNDQQGGANPAGQPIAVVTGIQSEKFDTNDPTSWFSRFEATLRINRVPPPDQFDYLLASLHREARQPVAYALQTPPEDDTTSYQWLKALLVEAHSKTAKEKLRQLLAGERIGDRKPSVFLSHLRDLAPDTVDNDLLKEFWWKELPSSMRTILSTMSGADTQALATAADAIHSEIGTTQLCAIRPAAASSTERHKSPHRSDKQAEPTLGEALKMIRDIQKQINELKEERGRRRTRDSSSSRHRGQTRHREQTPNRPEGICYYHHIFGDKARNCRPPCTHAKN